MSTSTRRRAARFVGVTAVIVLTVPFLVGNRIARAASHPDCDPVHGQFDDHLVTPPPALTTEGRVRGAIHGDLHFALLAQIPSATPNVAFYDARSSIHTKKGDLFFDEAGATDGVSGNFSVLQTITGGTGDYLGATGQLFAHGNFNFSTFQGTGEYVGTVCTP